MGNGAKYETAKRSHHGGDTDTDGYTGHSRSVSGRARGLDFYGDEGLAGGAATFIAPWRLSALSSPGAPSHGATEFPPSFADVRVLSSYHQRKDSS